MFSRIFLCLFISVITFSCAKEEFKEPEVFIIGPSPGSTYKVYDSIPVFVQVQSEEQLSFLNIRLLNSSLISVNPILQKSIGGTSFTGVIQYAVSNKQLSDGQYFIAVTAGNNDVQKTAYQSIQIQSLPLELLGIYISVWSGSSGSIFELDSLQSFLLKGSVGGQPVSSAVNKDAATICFATRQPESLVCWNSLSLNQLWSISCLGTFLPCISHISGNVNSTTVSYREGFVKLINQQQVVSATLQSSEFGYPEHSRLINNSVLVQEYKPVNQERLIRRYNAQSGVGQHEQNISYDIKMMLPVSTSSMLLVANENSNIRILLYNLANDFISNQNQINNESVISAVSVNQSRHLICTVNGVYEYQSDLNQYFLISNMGNFSRMEYEPIGSLLYAIDHNILRVFSYQNSVLLLQNSIAASDTIRTVDLIYNK